MYRFSAQDIKKWNDKIEESPFRFSLERNNDISIISVAASPFSSHHRSEDNIMNPKKFLFSFSVCENRIEDFQDIINRFNNCEITQNIIVNSEKARLEKSTNFKMKKSVHNYNNRNFILFTYEFNDFLPNILAKITLLNDAIKFFSMKWAYEDSGKEIYLLKYGVGDIVSTISDRNGDYIISDIYYSKTSDIENHYEIQYDVNKIENETGATINYSHSIRCLEKDLKNNRKNRLKYILN